MSTPGRRAFSQACVRRWLGRQEAAVLGPGEQGEARAGGRRGGEEVVGQAAHRLVDRDEGPVLRARADLAEERGRHPPELAADPCVRGVREVLVAPQDVGPRAVGEVRDRADVVVAFASRELGQAGEAARAQAGRPDRPLRIEPLHDRLEQRDEQREAALRRRDEVDVERHRVRDDVRHPGDEAGERRHREARRRLAVHHRLQRVGAGLLEHRADEHRVVVHRDLVQRERAGVEVDRAAPGLEPDVVAGVEERVDERRAQRRRVEEVRPHAGAVAEQDRPALGRRGPAAVRRPAHVVQRQRAAVARDDREDPPLEPRPVGDLVPLAGGEALEGLGPGARRGEVGLAVLGGPGVHARETAREHRPPARLRGQPPGRARPAGADREEQAEEARARHAQDAGGEARVARVLAVLQMPGVEAAEQRRRVGPRVVEVVVVDVLEPDERDRPPGGVAGVQAVAHVPVPRAAGVDEQVEPARRDLERPAEAVAADPARAGREVLGPGDEVVDVVDLDGEMDRAVASDLAPAEPALVPVVGAEVDVSGERLAVGDRGHVATIAAAIRSAIAAIVRLGFAPTGPGMIEPSAMYRPVGAEDAPVRVDDAVVRGLAHRAAAERVHRDQAPEAAARTPHPPAEGAAQRAPRRLHPVEERARLAGVPAHVERLAAERHAPAGQVAAHAEQRQHRGRLARRPERLAEQRADARVDRAAQPRADLAPDPVAQAPEVLRQLGRLPQPLAPGGGARVLQVELAPARRVAVVHARRRRDRRAGRRVERPVGAAHEEQQVAVRAEPRPEAGAEPWQARPVGQQEAGRAERPGGEHDRARADLALGLVGRVEQVGPVPGLRRRGAGGSRRATRRRRPGRAASPRSSSGSSRRRVRAALR